MQLRDTYTNLIAVLMLIAFGLWIALLLKNPTIDALNVMTQLLLLAIALKGLSTWREQFKHKLQWEQRHMELKELRRAKSLLDKLANNLAVYYGNSGMNIECENYGKQLIPYLDSIIENAQGILSVLAEQETLEKYEPTQEELRNLIDGAKDEMQHLLNPAKQPGSIFRNATHSDSGLEASDNMTHRQKTFIELLRKYGYESIQNWTLLNKVEEQIKIIQSDIDDLEN